MERRRPGAPASSPAYADRRSLSQSPADNAGPLERRRPRRPTPTAGPSVSLVPTAAAPWSAGVLAGLRRPPAPQSVPCRQRRLPGAPASSPAYADRRPLSQSRADSGGPLERRRPRRPAPDLRSPSQSPVEPPCRPTVGREAHGPCPPAAVAGEDTGAPGLERPDVWSGGPLERRRPRRPTPTVGPSFSLPSSRRADRPWAGRPTDHARLRRWPVRTPALPVHCR